MVLEGQLCHQANAGGDHNHDGVQCMSDPRPLNWRRMLSFTLGNGTAPSQHVLNAKRTKRPAGDTPTRWAANATLPQPLNFFLQKHRKIFSC